MKLTISTSDAETIIRQHFGLPGGTLIIIETPNPSGLMPSQYRDLVDLIEKSLKDNQGYDIPAIKLYREGTKAGLYESKHAIQTFWPTVRKILLEENRIPKIESDKFHNPTIR